MKKTLASEKKALVMQSTIEMNGHQPKYILENINNLGDGQVGDFCCYSKTKRIGALN